MSSAEALTGIGVPPQAAQRLGQSYSLVNGVGTVQTGAGKILTKNVELNTAGGATATILPVSDIMEPFYVVNPDATTGLVFCPVGHTMNGTLNGSVSVAQNKAAVIWQYKPTFWCSVVSP